MTAIKISDAFTALLELKKDLSDVPQATFIRWCDYINKFTYKFVMGIDPERYIQEQFLQSQVGVNTYSLPINFRDMVHFGTGIYYLDTQTNLASDRVLPRTGYGKQQIGFYIKNPNIILTPINWQSSQPFMIRYEPKITALIGYNDYFTLDGLSTGNIIIDSEFLDYLVKALDLKYSQWDEEIGAESYSDARMDRELTELCKEFYQEANIYFLEDNCYTY